MTSDERTQLIEDIKKANTLRRGIVEMAERENNFDICAAWEGLDALELSISERIKEERLKG